MITIQKYEIPEDIRKLGNFYEGKNRNFLLKINEHTYLLDKGQTTLQQNLYTFVLEGYKEILHADGKLILRKNESAILKKGTYVVSERFKERNCFKNILIFFDDDFAQKISLKNTNIPSKENYFFEKVNEKKILNSVIQTLESYTKQGFCQESLEVLIALKIEEILLLLQHLNPAVSGFLQDISATQKNSLLNLFEEYYKENLQLNEYAHLSNMSVSTLKRQFRKEIGMSPFQWINNRRLEEAKQYLINPKVTISEIAYQLGFETLSHFSRVFKEKYDKTPTKYRNELLR